MQYVHSRQKEQVRLPKTSVGMWGVSDLLVYVFIPLSVLSYGFVSMIVIAFCTCAGETVAWILPFTSGGFLYIALVNVVPDLLEEKNPW